MPRTTCVCCCDAHPFSRCGRDGLYNRYCGSEDLPLAAGGAASTVPFRPVLLPPRAEKPCRPSSAEKNPVGLARRFIFGNILRKSTGNTRASSPSLLARRARETRAAPKAQKLLGDWHRKNILVVPAPSPCILRHQAACLSSSLMADSTAADPVFRNRYRKSRRQRQQAIENDTNSFYFLEIDLGLPSSLRPGADGYEPEPVFSLRPPLQRKKLPGTAAGTAAGTGSRQHPASTNAMAQRSQGASIKGEARAAS